MSESIKEGNALQVLSAEQRERAKQVLFNTEMVQAAIPGKISSKASLLLWSSLRSSSGSSSA